MTPFLARGVPKEWVRDSLRCVPRCTPPNSPPGSPPKRTERKIRPEKSFVALALEDAVDPDSPFYVNVVSVF